MSETTLTSIAQDTNTNLENTNTSNVEKPEKQSKNYSFNKGTVVLVVSLVLVLFLAVAVLFTANIITTKSFDSQTQSDAALLNSLRTRSTESRGLTNQTNKVPSMVQGLAGLEYSLAELENSTQDVNRDNFNVLTSE